MRNERVQEMTARRWSTVAAALALGIGLINPLAARQAVPPGACRIIGSATSGASPLPGVAITVTSPDGGEVRAATSTDPNGGYRLTLPPGSYRLTAELMGFTPFARDMTFASGACDSPVDLTMTLRGRTPPPAAAAPEASSAEAVSAVTTPAAAAAAGGRSARPAQATGRGQATADGARFETLAVQTQASAAAGLEVNPPEREAEAAALLLPPGFATDGPTQAVAVTGNMASLDRGMMNDRLEAIGRGEFDPATGEFAQGFGPGGQGGFGGPGGIGQGRGGPGGPGGGRGGFVLGGRGGRQNGYSLTTNYTFGGSALDSTPYQLRDGSPVTDRHYTQQNFGATVGGPVKIPHLYDGTRRTNFSLSYSGRHGADLFDQYATVPSAAMRGGDFSSLSRPIVDPLTGLVFSGNTIPTAMLSPQSMALLRFVPLPNLDGDARNFHYVTTSGAGNDSVNLRVTHNFTENAGRAGGRGGRGGGFGGPGGRGGRGQAAQATSVSMTAQMQYRRNDNDQNNVFPALGGLGTGSSLSVPLAFNIVHKRMLHNVNVSVSRTRSSALNRYAFVEDVAGDAGIAGVSADPFDWGVPQLSFSSLTGLRDVTPSRRTDSRVALGYTWTRPSTRHTFRAGADVRFDRSSSQTDSNPNGAFVFTGLYSGLDFSDFLLGLSQQAALQYGPGNVQLSGRSFSLFVQDDWRKSSNLTFNLGLRYELLRPYAEGTGQMVNLDANPDFTAVAPVVSGGTGPYSGSFADALIDTDTNNLAPRLGFAWRVRPGTVLRGGYGVSYNSGTYSTIARQLTGQPPFATTNTSIGTVGAPLWLADPFVEAEPDETTNSYGVAADYALGLVQTFNADLSRDLRQVWNVSAGYTQTRGSSLDIVRAPNRDPDGIRIDGVQPFLWETSEGESVLHAGTFRLRRRPARGVGFGATYTIARSRDNASTLGGGGTVVAQDDRNLAAEWGLSSFDRRHQLSADVSVELPFGPNRPWLSGGGPWAALLRDWRATSSFTWQSGTPYTARVLSSASDAQRGTNGTLRADYNGSAIQLDAPTIDRYFNTAAFSLPAAGAFGSSARNLIVGPGSRQLNAQFSRDVRLGGNRAVTLQLNATNLLNMVNYASIDTVVNSPTFGEVLSVRPMRSMQFNLRFRF